MAKVLVVDDRPANRELIVDMLVLDGHQVRRVEPTRIDQGFVTQHVRLLADQLFKKTSELRSMEQRVVALHKLNVELAQEDDPIALLEQFCRGERELTGAKYSMLALKGGVQASFTSIGGMDPTTAAGMKVDKPGADDFDAGDEQLLVTLGAQVGRIYEKRKLHLAALQESARLRVDVERRKKAEIAVGTVAERLSRNEREIVRMVAEGKSTMEVAQSLVLSPRTVEAYRARVMHKLDIADLPSLVKFAIRSGITTLGTQGG